MRRGLLWTALFAGWGARGNEVGASRMSRIGSRMAAGSIVAIAALLCAGGCKQSDPVQAELDPYSSFVSKTGDIGFPANFPSGFVFIGSWAVTGDGGVADIHSVYARPDLSMELVANQPVSPGWMVSGSDQFRRTVAGGL